MSAELRIFLGDESERMLRKYHLNPQKIAVNAIQEALHVAAICHEPWEKE